MFNLFLSPQNIPFSVAIALMAVIGLMEGLSVVIGASLSAQLESILPDGVSGIDVDGPDIDADADADFDAMPSAFTRLLGWLHIGRVPILVLFVLFLTFFGLSGFIIQATVHSMTGSYFPPLVASAPAFLVSVPGVRIVGAGLAKLIPKDETTAVSPDSFVGAVAVIVAGTAKGGYAAEAKLKDKYGQDHYVMVEPDVKGEEFGVGAQLLLVTRNGSVFRGIKAPPEMLDE